MNRSPLKTGKRMVNVRYFLVLFMVKVQDDSGSEVQCSLNKYLLIRNCPNVRGIHWSLHTAIPRTRRKGYGQRRKDREKEGLEGYINLSP